jgi:hypothetical protein
MQQNHIGQLHSQYIFKKSIFFMNFRRRKKEKLTRRDVPTDRGRYHQPGGDQYT